MGTAQASTHPLPDNFLAQLPVSLLGWVGSDEEAKINADTSKGMTLKDYARSGKVTKFKPGNHGLQFQTEGKDFAVEELARGDWDGDGTEDALISVTWHYLPEANGNGNGHHTNGRSSNGHSNGHSTPTNGNGKDVWNCSDKQRDLIIKIVDEHKLDKKDIEQLSLERFSKGVKLLNKLEASGLIDELLEKHGGKKNGTNRFQKAGGR